MNSLSLHTSTNSRRLLVLSTTTAKRISSSSSSTKTRLYGWNNHYFNVDGLPVQTVPLPLTVRGRYSKTKTSMSMSSTLLYSTKSTIGSRKGDSNTNRKIYKTTNVRNNNNDNNSVRNWEEGAERLDFSQQQQQQQQQYRQSVQKPKTQYNHRNVTTNSARTNETQKTNQRFTKSNINTNVNIGTPTFKKTRTTTTGTAARTVKDKQAAAKLAIQAIDDMKLAGMKSSNKKKDDDDSNSNKLFNLATIEQDELESLIVTVLKYPKYRAQQVWHWIRDKGILDPIQMTNIPDVLRQHLIQYTRKYCLELVYEVLSNDGTIKRAYKCYDGQLIESVLMPYNDGRYTACISSQAGCAQGCVFCATGQMGLARQLTSDEIYEQVVRFSTDLQKEPPTTITTTKKTTSNDDTKKTKTKNKRLSNIVFMGMGEPLANYKNVVKAVQRITSEIGIGARKITISTVGIVPIIRKLIYDTNMPPVRLAVSLHCSTDTERSLLLPANDRNGGLYSLMEVLDEYITVTGRRITFEWALIDGTNDTPEVARQLGRLITQGITTTTIRDDDDGNERIVDVIVPKLRRDMVHINVIPLNPTTKYSGSPSQRHRVDTFVDIIQNEFSITCTPRVRRGIDIDAGCGQLKSKVLLQQQQQIKEQIEQQQQQSMVATKTGSSGPFTVGLYDDDEDDDEEDVDDVTTSTTSIDEQSSDEVVPNIDDEISIPVLLSVDESTIAYDIDDNQVFDFNDTDIVYDDNDDDEDDDDSYVIEEYECVDDESFDAAEAERLIALVQGTTIDLSKI